MAKKKVGIFGGLFNPVHNGHIAVVNGAIEQLTLDKLIVVPCADPPHKKQPTVSAATRYELTVLAFKNINNVEVSKLEIDRQGPSYIIDTIRIVAEREKTKPFLIIGADNIDEIIKWRNADAIKSEAEIVSFLRPGYVDKVDIIIEPCAISSTEIRARCRMGLSIESMVPEEVAAYIAEHSLYNNLRDFGFSNVVEREFTIVAEKGEIPGRVIAVNRHNYSVISANGELIARIPGKMLHKSGAITNYPAVGDFIALDINSGKGVPLIRKILPRKGCFSRITGRKRREEQLLAANIDKIIIVQGLDNDLNVRRLERFVVQSCDSGCEPIIVYNKLDKKNDYAKIVQEASLLFKNTTVIAISAKWGDGFEKLISKIEEGKTAVFIGSSGSGKSTIINRLAGEAVQETSAISSKRGKGRHTTVRRELFLLPNGGLVVDTPGIREIGLINSEEGLTAAFSEIDKLSENCRFSDCGHDNEPDCAVLRAVYEGKLERERVDNWHKLKAELEKKQSRRNRWAEKRLKEKSIKRDRITQIKNPLTWKADE